MKPGKSLVIYGALAILVMIALAWIIQSPPSPKTELGSCSLIGYTNRSGTNFVLLQVTNHTPLTLVCFAEPRMIRTQRPDEVNVKDLYPAAHPVFLPPHGAFAFVIPCSTDTNLLYVPFDLEETEFGLPRWKKIALKILRSAGLATFNPRHSHLPSPPFGKGEPNASP